LILKLSVQVASFSLSFCSLQAHSEVLARVFYPWETTCQNAVGIETFFQAGFLPGLLLPQTVCWTWMFLLKGFALKH